jgi:hypothetical protein
VFLTKWFLKGQMWGLGMQLSVLVSVNHSTTKKKKKKKIKITSNGLDCSVEPGISEVMKSFQVQPSLPLSK